MFIEKNGTFQLKIHICIGIADKYIIMEWIT